MKRDILTIKEILTAVEEDLVKKGHPFELSNIDSSILEGHLKLLENENLIQVESKQGLSTGEELYYDISLTNRGYDFIQALKKKSVFSKLEKLKDPLKILIPIAIDLLQKN
jgi:predicted transcriptional regulator